MPVIRYRTGDLATWSSTPCKCGRTLPLLAHLQGRALDSVTLPSGRTLFWTFFHEVLAPFTQLQQWRVIQTAPNAISLQLVTEPQHVPSIESALRSQLPEPIKIHSTPMESIPLNPGEKFRAVLRSPNL